MKVISAFCPPSATYKPCLPVTLQPPLALTSVIETIVKNVFTYTRFVPLEY